MGARIVYEDVAKQEGCAQADLSVRTSGFFDALKLRNKLRKLLSTEGFVVVPFVNFHRKEGVSVFYHFNAFADDRLIRAPVYDPWFDLSVKVSNPTPKTDELVRKMGDSIELSKRNTAEYTP